MKKIIFTTIIGLVCSAQLLAQASGNILYKNKRNNEYNDYSVQAPAVRNQQGLYVEKDSLLFVNVNVLMNTEADYYILVLGVNQSEKTSKEAMRKINDRIEKFKNSLPSKFTTKKNNIYVDFITQTKIYDYALATNNQENIATQKQLGFQTKKNINIRFDDLSDLDLLIEKAADQDIYDIIKVDYVVVDNMKIHKQLLEEAASIALEKKDQYLKNSNLQLESFYNQNSDNFYSIYPDKQYQTYQAYESGTITYQNYYDNRGSFIKKDLLMDKTSFYEGEDPSNFDKVINPGTPRIGVQFVLNYSIKYYIKKK